MDNDTVLNQRIEVIAVEAIAQSRLLLTLKNQQLDDFTKCVQLIVSNQALHPLDELDMIYRVTTVNAFDFIDPGLRSEYTISNLKNLTLEDITLINSLLLPSLNR